MEIDWSRSETIALAKESCTHCHGHGLRQYGRDGRNIPCNCVLRNIFRACYSRFRSCVEKERHMSHARLEMVAGRIRHQSWGRKDEGSISLIFVWLAKEFWMNMNTKYSASTFFWGPTGVCAAVS